MSTHPRTQLLHHLTATVDFTSAAEVMAARVALGTASWSERIRYHLRLGPSKEAFVLANKQREFKEAMARFRSQFDEADR